MSVTLLTSHAVRSALKVALELQYVETRELKLPTDDVSQAEMSPYVPAAAEWSKHHACIAVWSEAAVVMGVEDNPHVELPVMEDLPVLQNVHTDAPVLGPY